MRYLHSLTSLNNLKNNNAGGQIATIMILMMVAVLIFILVTINMGNVSERATRLANAADSATLMLGSTLATQTYMLKQQLGANEVCVKGGLLGVILAVILVIIAIISFQYYFIPAIIAGAIGGAIGGAIIHGNLKGAAMGALQGAQIGAAIAGGAQMLGGGPPPAPVEGAMTSSTSGAELMAGEGMLESTGALQESLAAGGGGFSSISGAPLMVSAPSTLGMVVGAALPAAASIYNSTVEEKMTSTALANLVKMLNGLPEYDAFRESIFFQAFSQTVDDPNFTEADPYDLDGDGDYTDPQPAFSYWWYNHLRFLQNKYISGAQVIENFVTGTLIPTTTKIESFLPDMDRQGIECNCPECDTGTSTEKEKCKASRPYGPMEQLFRAITFHGTPDAKSEIEHFWRPGPSAKALASWYGATSTATGTRIPDTEGCTFLESGQVQCPGYGTCTPIGDSPGQYDCGGGSPIDEFDGLRAEYEEFLDWTHALLNADDCDNFFYDPNELDKTDNWLDILYKLDRLKTSGHIDKKFRGDFYDTLYVGALGPEAQGESSTDYTSSPITELGIKQWIEHIEIARGYLSPCKISYATVSNPVNISNQIEQVDPYCNEYDHEKSGSFYPCNWTFATKEISGVYATPKTCADPPCDFEPCKLYAGDKANINTDVINLKDYINNLTGVKDDEFNSTGRQLEERIRGQIQSHNPCNADKNPSTGITDCDLLSIGRVTITDLRLEIIRTGFPPQSKSKLKYSYRYEYTCECCQSDGCCTCNAYDTDGTTCIDCRTANCCSRIAKVHHGADAGSGQGEIELKDLDLINIPSGVNEWLPTSDFINALDEISNTLNDPAKFSDTFATIDQDLSTDEFVIVLAKLQEQEDFLLEFLPKVKEFYDEFQDKKDESGPQPKNAGGTSPVYTWTDKTGEHSVLVQVGKAMFSKISREEHGNFLVNKKCLVVEKVNAGQAWVKITREDQGEKPITSSGKQSLGFRWNPGFGRKQTITRKARAQYGSHSVGIRDISNDASGSGGLFPGE